MRHNKILVLNLGGIGDLLLSSSSLKALCDSGEQVDFLVADRAVDFVERLNLGKKVFGLSLGYGGRVKFQALLRILKTLISLRKERYDLVINMRTIVSNMSAIKLRLLIMIINANKSAGRNTDGLGSFLDISIDETLLGTRHEMEYDIELIKKLGYKISDRNLFFPLSEEDKTFILNNAIPFGKKKIVTVHPGGMLSRRWSRSRYVQLIDALYGLDCFVVLTGSKAEDEFLAEIVANCRNDVINLCGKLDIYQLAALIKLSDIFVSGDTGPMHIAAAMNVDQLALLGPGDLLRYDPRKINNKARVIYYGASCGPCVKEKCSDMRCLKKISVDEVVESMREILRSIKK